MIQYQKLLTLHWHSFSRWDREGVCIIYRYKGSRFIWKERSHTKVNILRFAARYLNVTIYRQPETQNRRSEETGLAKHAKTGGLTGTDPGFALQDPVGRIFGQFGNQTELFLRSEHGPLAGYPDPLLTLFMSIVWRFISLWSVVLDLALVVGNGVIGIFDDSALKISIWLNSVSATIPEVADPCMMQLAKHNVVGNCQPISAHFDRTSGLIYTTSSTIPTKFNIF